jgi:hypothetical protein
VKSEKYEKKRLIYKNNRGVVTPLFFSRRGEGGEVFEN